MKAARYLHSVDLGPELHAVERAQIMGRDRDSELMRAVLQELRDKAADMNMASYQPPANLADKGDYRAYHDGGAIALEEMFWALADPSLSQAEAVTSDQS